MVSWIKHSVDRFVIVSIFIPKLRLILILNSFLGSSDSLVFSELFHSLAPRPLAARSISDFLLTYLVIAGDSFEMDAVGALRLSPLRRGLAIDSTVDIFTFYVPHRHVYGEQWI